MNISQRLKELRDNGLKVYAVDVIKVLNAKEIKVSSADFSRWTNGVEDPPRSELVLSEADKIVSQWEKST